MLQNTERLEPVCLEDFVLHLPKPTDLDASRRELLVGVRYLIVVGSPRRARRIATLAHEKFGARQSAEQVCYCDLTVPERGETGREYAIYVPELPASGGGPGARVAVVSHGIGKAGVEIVLSELPAAIALAQGGESPKIEGVIRCGTRGTLSQVPVGSIALTTSCHDDGLNREEPSSEWLDRLRAAARARGMTVVPDGEIDARDESDWPPATQVLAEGAGISTSFFWQGQGRALFRCDRGQPSGEELAGEARQNAELLQPWVDAGIRWIEMEDYTVMRVARLCGLPAVSLGAILGHRRRPDGRFQNDYSKVALELSELIPSEIALEAIVAHRL